MSLQAERRLGRREAGIAILVVSYGAFLWLLWSLVRAEQWDAAVSLFTASLPLSVALVAGLWSLKVFDPMSRRGGDAGQF